MPRHRITLVALAVVATLVAASGAAAQDPNPPRTNAGPLGEVSMIRTVEPDADGSAILDASLKLNVSVARDAGARYILVSVGNDANADLAVEPVSFKTRSGTDVEAERLENAGTYRVQWWLNVNTLPASVDLALKARADAAGRLTDVETLVMAFDPSYREVPGSNGKPLTLQSFTTVNGTGEGATIPPPGNDTGNGGSDIGDGGNLQGPGGPDPNAGDDPEPTKDPKRTNRVPVSGTLALAAGLGAAALSRRVTRHR